MLAEMPLLSGWRTRQSMTGYGLIRAIYALLLAIVDLGFLASPWHGEWGKFFWLSQKRKLLPYAEGLVIEWRLKCISR